MENTALYGEMLEILQDREKAEQVVKIIYADRKRERAIRRRVQMEGIRRARARGVSLGRPMKHLPDNFHGIYKKFHQGEMSASEAAAMCGMGVSTFYRKAREYIKRL